jgi:hypothetical protein
MLQQMQMLMSSKCLSSEHSLDHVVQVHKASGVPYREMLFFDNEVHSPHVIR